MKKTLIACMCLLSVSTFAGEINVKVNGMVCSMCAQGIKKKFSKLDAIKEIDVNLDEKIVRVKTNDGKDISDQQINDVIKEAGYNVSTIERK